MMSNVALWKGCMSPMAAVCWFASCWEIVRRMSTVICELSGWSEVALWPTNRVMTAEKMPDCSERRQVRK